MTRKLSTTEFFRTVPAIPLIIVALFLFVVSALLMMVVDQITGRNLADELFNW